MPTKDYIAGYDDCYNLRDWQPGLSNSEFPYSYQKGWNDCCVELPHKDRQKLVNALQMFQAGIHNGLS